MPTAAARISVWCLPNNQPRNQDVLHSTSRPVCLGSLHLPTVAACKPNWKSNEFSFQYATIMIPYIFSYIFSLDLVKTSYTSKHHFQYSYLLHSLPAFRSPNYSSHCILLSSQRMLFVSGLLVGLTLHIIEGTLSQTRRLSKATQVSRNSVCFHFLVQVWMNFFYETGSASKHLP